MPKPPIIIAQVAGSGTGAGTPTAPWLATVEVTASEMVVMKGLAEAIEREGAAEVGRGAAALLEAVLRLLGGFIGEGLTLRLVRRIWADLPPPGAGSGTEES